MVERLCRLYDSNLRVQDFSFYDECSSNEIRVDSLQSSIDSMVWVEQYEPGMRHDASWVYTLLLSAQGFEELDF